MAVDDGPRSARTATQWSEIERTSEFQELVAARRRWVNPATAFFLFWFLLFIVLSGYAEEFMAERVIEGVTVGYLLALSQFVMVAVLGVLYLRVAKNKFEPLQEAALRRAEELQR